MLGISTTDFTMSLKILYNHCRDVKDFKKVKIKHKMTINILQVFCSQLSFGRRDWKFSTSISLELSNKLLLTAELLTILCRRQSNFIYKCPTSGLLYLFLCAFENSSCTGTDICNSFSGFLICISRFFINYYAVFHSNFHLFPKKYNLITYKHLSVLEVAFKYVSVYFNFTLGLIVNVKLFSHQIILYSYFSS